WDLKKKKFEVIYHLDSIVKGHYTASGRILILPITGDENIKIVFNIDYEIEKGDDGKEYVVPKDLHFDFEVRDNANFQLTNLFNGNKELSDIMLKFLNENWKQVSQEFGRPMVAEAAKILFKNVKAYFKNNPMSDIANI
ncbi:Juvenile hormone binding protein-like protein, partial [Operophtera brumata]